MPKTPFQPERRSFLATLSVCAAALSLPACRDREDTEQPATAAPPTGAVSVDRSLFPQSVASGDPRPDRLLLWTRIASDAPRQRVWLQVAVDERFETISVQQELLAEAAHDHCLRIRLTDLAPAQSLHYRFVTETPDGWRSSPIGSGRSAPEPDADTPVRFAVLTCQDFGGRWYNSLLPLLDEELDFILHLGDFIYETAGDPSFQNSSGERSIAFKDLDGAISLGEGDAVYYAAQSLDNYRQLHRTFRTDPVLQRLLERAPLLAIWDDHEFSDDSWQATGTYTDGRRDETNPERRRNAEQAYFEYMPLDRDQPENDGGHVAREALFPQVRIYRRRRFGKHVELFLTDTRSERPDHLIPEDAFPGALAFDETSLREKLPQLGLDVESTLSGLMPYVDLDADPFRALKPTLVAALNVAYSAAGLPMEAAGDYARKAASGPIAWLVLQATVAQWNAKAPGPMQIELPPSPADAKRGLPWAAIGKTSLFGATGSRYFVTLDGYGLYAALRSLEGIPDPMSGEQRAWLDQAMGDSDARWKTLVSSISMTPIVLDLSKPEIDAPAMMRRRFLLNVDQWDGFPQARQRLLDLLDRHGGAVVLSGDIHAAFASQHSERTVEITVPAVSSQTLSDILAGEVERDPSTAQAGRRLVAALDQQVMEGSPVLRHAETRVHGVGIAEVDGTRFDIRVPTLPSSMCRERFYDEPEKAAAQGSTHRFSIDAETRTLQKS
ncbi:MAG: alkaline phosphatase D family protein [Lysobacteraceae bacterium]|nr:alkaline phosphatase D family protein [Xanthomonadales bacterium]